VHVVIEAAPGWVEMFHHAGAVVHVVDPKQAKAFAESLGSSGAKDDKRDGASLAEMGRSRELPVWTPAKELEEQLHLLSIAHESAVEENTSAEQRLRSFLRERFPSLEAGIKDFGSAWVHRLLGLVPTPWHGRRTTKEELSQAMKGSGAHRSSLERVWEALDANDAPWLTETMAQTHALLVGRLVERVAVLSRQVATIDKELDRLTAELDLRHLLETVGGIAMKMAIRLIVFGLGMDDAPKDRDQLGILMGACPVFRRSGKDRKGKSKGHAFMRHAADPRARSTMYLLGRVASQRMNWASAMYGDGRKRGQSAATVYRRIARCLLRILSAMVRTGQAYDNDRYVAALKRNGVAWAHDIEPSSEVPVK